MEKQTSLLAISQRNQLPKPTISTKRDAAECALVILNFWKIALTIRLSFLAGKRQNV